MSKIKLLPKWIFPDSIYSVYDTESGTAIEMVSRVYNAMRTLQEEYNYFVDEINKTITEFIEGVEQDQECFEKRLIKIIHDYIAMIDEKIKMQDAVIDDAVNYMKTNLGSTLTNILREMRETGELNEYVLSAFEDVVERLTNLEEFKSDAEPRIIELETFKTDAEIRITDLEIFKTETEIEINDLETSFESYKLDNEGKIDELEIFKTTTEGSIETINTNIETINTTLSSNTDRIINLEENKPYYTYDSETETLTFNNIERGE